MTENKPLDTESPSQEKLLHAANGFAVLLLDLILSLAAIAAIVLGAIALGGQAATRGPAVGAVLLACGIIWLALPSWVLLCGIKVLKPNEALVLTLFGRYVGTLKSEGIYFVNPFCTAVNPTAEAGQTASSEKPKTEAAAKGKVVLHSTRMSKKISLKTMTLNNEKQKINDLLGNPSSSALRSSGGCPTRPKAVFQVDNYREFLSIQCDSPCATSSASIPTTRPRRAATSAACAAPRRRSPRTSSRRSLPASPRPAWKFWRHASPIWPMPRRSQPSCCSASRLQPSLTRAR